MSYPWFGVKHGQRGRFPWAGGVWAGLAWVGWTGLGWRGWAWLAWLGLAGVAGLGLAGVDKI